MNNQINNKELLSTFNSSNLLLSKILEQTRKTSESYRIKHFSVASETFIPLIDQLLIFLSLLGDLEGHLRILNPPLPTEEANFYSHKKQNLFKILDILYHSQAQGDSVKLSDILEFELHPHIESWQNALFPKLFHFFSQNN